MLKQFAKDESGFVVSAELVLIATLLVIGLIVGLSEVQHAVVCELNDVGEAIGSLNQSFLYTGFAKFKTCGFGAGQVAATTSGSLFFDNADQCDWNECALGCLAPAREAGICGVGGIGGGRGGIGGGSLGLGTGSRAVESSVCAPAIDAPTCAVVK